MSRSELDQVEQLLRQNAARLCDETTARCLHIPSMKVPDLSDEAAARTGAEHVHGLVLIVAALYPSEITLRKQYEWAATGLLDRRQIGYDYLASLLRVYFDVARDVLDASMRPALDRLEAFMSQVLTDVFWGPAES